MWSGLDVQEGERGPQETGERDQVHHGERHGVGEHLENLLTDDVIGRAERIPAGTQTDYLYCLLGERFITHLFSLQTTTSLSYENFC